MVYGYLIERINYNCTILDLTMWERERERVSGTGAFDI